MLLIIHNNFYHASKDNFNLLKDNILLDVEATVEWGDFGQEQKQRGYL